MLRSTSKPALTALAALVAAAAVAGACGTGIPNPLRPPIGYGSVAFGPDLSGLPANPTLDEQVAAGRKQVELFKGLDSTLDANGEFLAYVSGIVRKLVEHSDRKPPYPIEAHVVSEYGFPVLPFPGGQIVVSEKVLALVKNEAELAAAIAHQLGHEFDNDFELFWRIYQTGEPKVGTKEWRAEINRVEERADAMGARMMYDAGWDPNAMSKLLSEFLDRQVDIGTILEEQRLERVSQARLEKLAAFVKLLPGKPGLMEDSPQFAKFEESFWKEGPGAEALRKSELASARPPFGVFDDDELVNLPLNPTIDQQVAVAKKALERMKVREPTLDSKHELVAYFNDIVQRLLEHSPKQPPYKITVHVSSLPVANAYALMGGTIIVYERYVDGFDSESELVMTLAHEVAHEVHNDALAQWRGLKGEHRAARFHDAEQRERRADEDGLRMMYAAGWDPSGVPDRYRRMNVRLRLPAAGSHGPQGWARSDDRLHELEEIIESLPPKAGLIKDSERFQELKRRY
jgi:predicted Zn-dependent protease